MTHHRSTRRALPAILTLAVTAAALTACAEDDRDPKPAPPPAAASSAPPAPTPSAPASSGPQQPAAPRMVSNDGHRVAFYVTPGGSPTIVLDSGGGEDHTEWDKIVPELHAATGSRIITYDRAGMGASDEVPGPWKLPSAVSDLEAGLRDIGVTEDVVLVAHSQAGEIATSLAQKNPALLSGAVLVDANLPQFFTDETITQLVTLTKPKIDEARKAPSTKETRQLLATADGFEENHRAFHRMSWPASVPVTVILSGTTPFGDSPEAAKLWRDAAAAFVKAGPDRTLLTAEGTSHEVPADRPDFVVREAVKMAGKR